MFRDHKKKKDKKDNHENKEKKDKKEKKGEKGEKGSDPKNDQKSEKQPEVTNNVTGPEEIVNPLKQTNTAEPPKDTPGKPCSDLILDCPSPM